MEAYRERPSAAPRKPAATLERLLLKNRSHRAYDSRYLVREDQLRRIIAVNARIPSARNQQVLRFRPVLADEAPTVTEHIRLGGALPELHLPAPGTEPNAYIICCSTIAEDRYVDMDLGISAQSMLLRATEMGLNGICIGGVRPRRHPQGFRAAVGTVADSRHRQGRGTHRVSGDRRRRRPHLLSKRGSPLRPENPAEGINHRIKKRSIPRLRKTAVRNKQRTVFDEDRPFMLSYQDSNLE